MTGLLVLPFPTPSSDELRKAYNDLYLAVNGDEDTEKRIGNPNKLPRPWDPPTCTKPALRRELWAWLDEVVTWFNHEYVWDHNAGMIPACWPQHPHLVHEIAVLADQRRRAGIDPTSSARRMAPLRRTQLPRTSEDPNQERLRRTPHPMARRRTSRALRRPIRD